MAKKLVSVFHMHGCGNVSSSDFMRIDEFIQCSIGSLMELAIKVLCNSINLFFYRWSV